MRRDGNGRPVDILLVEDNPADARLAAEALKECDFDNRLHWAADGVQAMEFLRREGKDSDAPRPDLILLDLNLPKKDGREVLAELKQDPLLKRIPVVVLTTSQAEADKNRSYDLHANCYITKPGHWDGYAQVIRSIKDFWFTSVNLPTESYTDLPEVGRSELPTAGRLEIPAVIKARSPGAMRLLLIEDNPGDARLVREMLVDTGEGQSSVVHVGTLREGLRRLARERFDAVLVDLSLPDSQGLDTLETLNTQATGMPIVVLTGSEDEAMAARALRQGAQDYLVKGRFDGEWLLRAVEHAIERTRSGKYLHYLAHHDVLTELPNRTLLHDRLSQALEHARRNKQRLAVLFLDLDHFKKVNDAMGHAVGDQVLQQVAARLNACVRASDTVARVGGDEFTILLPEISRVEDVTTVAEKILAGFRAPVALGERNVRVTTSIGACLYPNDGEDTETLLKNADAAMYRAKKEGRDNFQAHSLVTSSRTSERLSLIQALRLALQRDELLLHYQPTVDAISGKIIALEALLRWQPPEGALLYPRHFLQLAEESGLIVDIGAWVLRHACAQARAWQAAGLQPLRVGVNLSYRQLNQGKSLVESVACILKETGLDPQRLELDVTEESIMKDEPAAIRTLRNLREMGARITIDDFGTGYASLSRLRCFPFGSVKIDQTFIRDVTINPDDAAIVAAITAMGHSLRMTVVAEGVETGEQVSFLLRHQIDQMQGRYFSDAVTAEECTELIRTGTPAFLRANLGAPGNGHGTAAPRSA